MISRAKPIRNVPLTIALIYAFVSALWIFFSDRLLGLLVGDLSTYQSLQTYKGWAFISFSALVLYLALRVAWKRLEDYTSLMDMASGLAHLGGWRRDLVTGKMTNTPGIYAAYAMPEGPFDLEKAYSCFAPADRETLAAHRDRVIQERQEYVGEFLITALDGTKKWLRIKQSPQLDSDGTVKAIVGAVQDISEIVSLRHEAEAQTRRVWNMVDNMPDGFFLLDRDLRFTFANPTAERIIANAKGTGPDYLGHTLWDVFPRVAAQLREPVARLLADGKPMNILLEVRETNEYRRAISFITPEGIGTHLREVTEEIRAQRKLRESEERFRLASIASQDVLFDWDVVNDQLQWSDAARTRYGFDTTVFPRKIDHWLSRVHPDDQDRMRESLEASLRPGQPSTWSDTYRFLANDDSVVHVHERGMSLVDETGRVVRMVGTIADVSDAHAEQLRLRAIIEVAADAIYEFDPARNVVVVSEGIQTAFGHDWVGEQTIPTPWQEAVVPEDRDRVIADFNAFLASNDLRWRCEYRMARADGRIVHVREKVMAVRDEHGRPIRTIGSMDDVTQERRAEERLKQSERIQAIGTLTGGVAHDFNNLLTIILGNAEVLELDDKLDEGSRRLASVILKAAERGAELTSRLLAFTGKQPLAPKAVDACQALAEIARLLERTLPANITLTINTTPDLWLVEADPAQLNAAILNLATNARDAMPEGGTLEIDCANITIAPSAIAEDSSLREGEFVRVRVIDNGTGIPEDIVEHVFEPFFTTKPRGAGTGLGLSMVHGFVQQSGGFTQISTKPGQGTCISFYLPRSHSKNSETGLDTTILSLAEQGEHVLVVEDNPLLLPHVCEMVKSLGYRVSAAPDAKTAMEVLGEKPDIVLLFTDVVLPGNMNGPALARKATALYPNLKVLFTSGNTEHAFLDQTDTGNGVLLLSKPYRRHELASKLREIIGQ